MKKLLSIFLSIAISATVVIAAPATKKDFSFFPKTIEGVGFIDTENSFLKESFAEFIKECKVKDSDAKSKMEKYESFKKDSGFDVEKDILSVAFGLNELSDKDQAFTVFNVKNFDTKKVIAAIEKAGEKVETRKFNSATYYVTKDFSVFVSKKGDRLIVTEKAADLEVLLTAIQNKQTYSISNDLFNKQKTVFAFINVEPKKTDGVGIKAVWATIEDKSGKIFVNADTTMISADVATEAMTNINGGKAMLAMMTMPAANDTPEQKKQKQDFAKFLNAVVVKNTADLINIQVAFDKKDIFNVIKAGVTTTPGE